MASEIPPRVRRLIAQHVRSLSALDVLLLLRATPERRWRPQEVGRALVSTESIARAELEELARTGVVRRDGDGFVYAPSSADEPVVDELAECYARRRNAVIGIIFAGDDRQVTALADAFRVRRRKG